MAKRIRRSKDATIMSYDALRQKILAIAGIKHPVMGDFIPDEAALYWRIGQTLAYHADDVLENLALELRRAGKPWQTRELAMMVQLYLRYPTIDMLSGRCIGRNQAMNLDELLDVGE
jgi:hypothetical protein